MKLTNLPQKDEQHTDKQNQRFKDKQVTSWRRKFIKLELKQITSLFSTEGPYTDRKHSLGAEGIVALSGGIVALPGPRPPSLG